MAGTTDELPLFAAVEDWIEQDVDPQDVAELVQLLTDARGGTLDAQAAIDELADRFAGPLEFGTAGLRGAMAAGPARMNRAVVIRAAAGLAAYLNDALQASEEHPAATRPFVVVGFDARHRSSAFAHDTAAVLTAAGIRVALYDGPRPTPTLAFAVRALDADAGVMVTASHNPAADNGYKVYLGGRIVTDAGQGAQIVPPYDTAIAARIAQAPPARAVPRALDGWDYLGDEVVARYEHAIPRGTAAGALRIVATPMHGVGGPLLIDALRIAGFDDVTLVPEQAAPDPDFPTVAFPNPEEPGALDLAFELAAHTRADLVIAVDPDADRCAVGIRDPYRGGSWRALHGDELGALLGEDAAEHAARLRIAPGTQFLANSIVSSRLLGRIAEHHGLEYRATLTGFKWISRVDDLVFGYEEAIGYCVDPGHVRDKDGISAAVRAATIVSRLRREGRGVMDTLDDLARRHGLHLTSQVNRRYADVASLVAATSRVLAAPPAELGGSPVVLVDDLGAGVDGLPPTPGVRLLAADGTRVVIRPSGTEPKVKAYLEVIEPLDRGATSEEIAEARRRAAERLRDLGAVVLPA
ncbi:phospho-sugar mutase [Rarobacter faecitabidus]|uniref:Phosphomannomutase n=1 Tax=Rarobacter faecitabidus TaxID=13243 RepID=A0A542ZV15_RARFA|nr:phospho-sugar mutase [Rarobacter faecitabidus]TQL64205.1 phosphomannomutase [Rarobacter faecitabidus]